MAYSEKEITAILCGSNYLNSIFILHSMRGVYLQFLTIKRSKVCAKVSSRKRYFNSGYVNGVC